MTARTLVPLIVAFALAGSAVLNVGSARTSLLQTREEGLRNDLRVMRQVVDQYRGDKGDAPRSLEALVREG
jgi:hypothetical protein